MISAVRLADRPIWLGWWDAVGHEPFAHPDYVRLFEQDEGDEALLLVVDQSTGSAILPIICRPLPPAAGAGRDLIGWTDAVSPYGYGGPFATGHLDWHAFYGEVIDWMQRERVVTCFVRMSPQSPTLTDDFNQPGCRAVVLAENVVVDCTRSADEQWQHYAHKVRKNVNKATRAGLRVRMSDNLQDLDSFLDVYRSTMRRRFAEDRYYFDDDFFACVGSLPKSVRVFDVIGPDGHLLSTELVLASDRFFYSFLGGTREEAFVHSPNDLLKHAVIEQARAEGKQAFVLGGGYSPGDGIFRYKRSFDESGVVPFVGVQLVGEAELYSELVTGAGGARSVDDGISSYFPAYRA